MSLRKKTFGLFLSVLAIGLLLPATALAQENTPKVDIFTGYSWYSPGATINGTNLNSQDKGGIGSFAYNFSKYVAGEVSGSGGTDNNNTAYFVGAGPRFTLRNPQFQPFIHGLVGFQHLDFNPLNQSNNGVAIKAGGGFDIPFSKHIGLRLIEADYVWSHQNFFPNGTINPSGAELSGGLMWYFGGAPPLPPLAASCSVQPTAVLAGEPATATANVTNIPPKHSVTYDWKTTGGKLTPKDSTATVDTTGLAPGQYTVTATATDPKAKKNAVPATCNAQFTINEPPKHPPTLSCSANPATVKSGEPATITSTGENPDNRPLTYSYTATAGRVSGTGTTATLDTAGAPAGPITVNCTVTDDRGLSATSSTTVNVEVPPPPPQASKIGECDFPNKAKPWRVDNTCKAVLDDVALALQRDPTATLVIVGQQAPEEKSPTLSAERAVNSKGYLSSGEAKQAIDASRMQTRTGTGGTTKAEFWIVPQGATFTGEGTQPVDESQIKARGRAPAPTPRKRRPAAPPQ
jgi:PKD domain